MFSENSLQNLFNMLPPQTVRRKRSVITMSANEMRERSRALPGNGMWPGLPCPLSLLPHSLRYDEMKNPYFTFLAPDNYYATSDDIDPQLMAETVKSFKSAAMGDSLKLSPATKAAVDNTLRHLRLHQQR